MNRPRLPRVDWVMVVLALGALMAIAAVLQPVRAASSNVLLIVDQDGNARLECDMPTPGQTSPLYLLPPQLAIVCHNPRQPTRIYRDGFEP